MKGKRYMFFGEDYINEVKEKNNIVDIVSMYTTLKKNGNNYTGLCPFHSEKTPSFSVSEEKQMYHCFGCGEGGTVIQFVRKIENYDFTETVKYLAQRAGIPLPDENAFESEEFNLKKKILEMNRIAARHYFDNLISENGKKAYLYLKERGLKNETIKEFGLGYSKNSWNDLYGILKSKGYKNSEILKSGLCLEKNGRIFDFFRDRVMFPVMDIRGNVVAFGGRIMSDQKPKYLNTGETPVFKKKEILFNFNKAKNTELDYFIIMEGYMDVISVYQAGFKNAVASLGTAFGPDHSRLLKRYKEKAVVSYDNDEAGREAAQKAVKILKKDGVNVKILKIKGAKDPDELIKKFGKDAYQSCIENAMSGFLFDIMNIYPKNGFLDEEDKVEFLKKAINILSELDNPLETEIYAKKLSELTKISYENITVQLKNKQKTEKNKKTKNFGKDYIPPKRDAGSAMIKLIVEHPSYYGRIKERISEESFEKKENKEIYKVFSKLIENNVKPDISMIMENLEGDSLKWASNLFIEKEPVKDFMKYFESLEEILKEKKFEIKEEKDGIKELMEYTEKLKNKQVEKNKNT